MTGAPLTIGTYNVGPGSDKAKVNEIVEAFEGGMDALGTQEMSDRAKVKAAVIRHPGIACFEKSDHKGSPAVPIFYNSVRWRPFASGTVFLGARFFAPEGVGPDWVKPKRLNYLFLRDVETHDAFVMANMHMPASLWADRRNLLGHRVIHRAADWAGALSLPVALTGDWNSKVGASILAPLQHAGLRSSQEVRVRQSHGKLKPLPTHESWTPDDVWKKRWHVNMVETRLLTSDHRMLVVHGQLH